MHILVGRNDFFTFQSFKFNFKNFASIILNMLLNKENVLKEGFEFLKEAAIQDYKEFINNENMIKEYEDNIQGYESAKLNLKSPLEINENNLSVGKELYEIYCSVCHGSKGDGMGILMQREKFLGIPSYADRDISEGSIYHVLMYGINLMGSHSGQVNEEERWQIAQYVMKLREELEKK